MQTNLLKSDDEPNKGENLRRAYESHYLKQNQRYVGFFALAAGILQLVLLIVDLSHISQAYAKTLILVMRLALSISVLIFAFFCLKRAFRSFHLFSWLISLFEGLAVVTFLLVFHQYDPPHYIIQSMGMIFLMMVVFFVANQWFKMVVLAAIGLFAFALSAWLKLGSSLPANEFWAGVFYMSAAFGLCAMVSFTLDLRGFNEFAAKQELIGLNTIDPLTKACNRIKLIADFDHWSAYCSRYHQRCHWPCLISIGSKGSMMFSDIRRRMGC